MSPWMSGKRGINGLKFRGIETAANYTSLRSTRHDEVDKIVRLSSNTSLANLTGLMWFTRNSLARAVKKRP